MSSNKAFYTQITDIQDHPKADKLQLATILGYQVVVGLDAAVGDEGVLFLPEAILEDAVIKEHNINYLRKGRVIAVKLRGEYSMGLFIKMDKPKDINALWHEYVPPVTQRTQSQQAKQGDVLNTLFPKHMDTQQYLANKPFIDKCVEEGWSIDFSVKTHGTSGRSANVRLPLEPKLWELKVLHYSYGVGLHNLYQKYLDWKYKDALSTIFTDIYGSRNVIFKPNKVGEVAKNFRLEAHNLFVGKLHPNEAVYYEILGYETYNQPIMQPYRNKPYAYGLAKGEWGIQVYRITQDGIDLSVAEVKERCKELGTVYVVSPIAGYGNVASNFEAANIMVITEVTTKYNPALRTYYSHTNEGLVIRLTNPVTKQVIFYKWKNPQFYIEEGINVPQPDL